MSEKFTSEALFGWQENGKNIYIQKIKALKPTLDFFFFFFWGVSENSRDFLEHVMQKYFAITEWGARGFCLM